MVRYLLISKIILVTFSYHEKGGDGLLVWFFVCVFFDLIVLLFISHSFLTLQDHFAGAGAGLSACLGMCASHGKVGKATHREWLASLQRVEAR